MILPTVDVPKVEMPGYDYAHGTRCGPFIFTSGVIPKYDGQLRTTGLLGAEVSIADGEEAARRCALLSLSIAIDVAGSRSRIIRVVQSNCYVACDENFTAISRIAEAARNVLAASFATCVPYSRSTIGVARLPVNSPVMFDFVFEVENIHETERG